MAANISTRFAGGSFLCLEHGSHSAGQKDAAQFSHRRPKCISGSLIRLLLCDDDGYPANNRSLYFASEAFSRLSVTSQG
jgi:hypothetical protein